MVAMVVRLSMDFDAISIMFGCFVPQVNLYNRLEERPCVATGPH